MSIRQGQVNLPNGTTDENGKKQHDTWHFETEAAVVQMTGYAKPTQTAAITANDTVMEAIGKLDSRVSENGGVPVDAQSTTEFALGADDGGVYVILPDPPDEEETGEDEEGEE